MIQGDGCAATVFQADAQYLAFTKDYEIPLGTWLVLGHYGSRFAKQLLRFTQNPPTAEADPVCDNCIGERLSANELALICKEKENPSAWS